MTPRPRLLLNTLATVIVIALPACRDSTTRTPDGAIPETASAAESAAPPPEPPPPEVKLITLAFAPAGDLPQTGSTVPAVMNNTPCSLRPDGTRLEIEIPEPRFRALGGRSTLRIPGWCEVALAIPAPDERRRAVIATPVRLTRAAGRLDLMRGTAGCDYTTAELVWKGPLADEPAATPSQSPLVKSLDFKGTLAWDNIPTGRYALVLKGADPRQVLDFTLDPDLAVTDAAQGNSTARSLPPSLSASYITYVPTREPSTGTLPSTASFYGVRLDIAKGAGEVMAALSSVGEGREITLQQLKPRPDTLWPVSSLVLREPSRAEFDCPLFFVDYHLTLETADGIVTLKGEFIPPEDSRSQADLLSRMRMLRQRQIQAATANAGLFEPGSVGPDYQRLPFFAVLATPELFSEHLRDRGHHVHSSLDMGTSLVMTRGKSGGWEARLMLQPPDAKTR